MKSLKQLRSPQSITSEVIAEDVDDNSKDDDIGSTLVALNHIAVISDDLYSVLGDGDEESTIDSEDITSILACYEMLITIHNKYAEKYDLPSTDDEVGDDYDDDIDECYKELEGAVTEIVTGVQEDRAKADLAKLDFDEEEGEEISEAFDELKFKRLAETGLVAPEDVKKVIRAMKVLDAGKVALSPEQRDLISSTFMTLAGLVTGDSAVFTKLKATVKATS